MGKPIAPKTISGINNGTKGVKASVGKPEVQKVHINKQSPQIDKSQVPKKKDPMTY